MQNNQFEERKESPLSAHLALAVGQEVCISEPLLTGVSLRVSSIRYLAGIDRGIPFKLFEYTLSGHSWEASTGYADDKGDIEVKLRVLPRTDGGSAEILLFWNVDRFDHDYQFLERISKERDVDLLDSEGSHQGFSRVDEIQDGYRAKTRIVAGEGSGMEDEVEYWDFQRCARDGGVTYTQYAIVENSLKSGEVSIDLGYEIDPLSIVTG